MHINYTYDIEPYSVNQDKRLLFTLNSVALNIPAALHCRIDGHLVRLCTSSGNVISMSMPLNHGITAN